MRLSFLLPLVLLGCPGPTTPTGTDTPTPDPVTQPPGTGEGDVALIRGYENGELVRAELVGVFANNLQDYLNVAHCVGNEETPCLTSLPELGFTIPYDRLDRYVENQSFYSYVGLTVPFGPYESFYQADERISWYYGDVTETGDIFGPTDLTIGVEWGEHDLAGAVDVPAGLTVLSPRQGETLRAFSDEEDFTLLWEPQGAEDMFLFIQTQDETEPGKMIRIEDNGSYTLDFLSLGLLDSTVLDVQLARWSFDTFELDGNDLQVHTTAEADFTVEYIQVGLRAPIDVYGGCDDPPDLPVGMHYGDLTGLPNFFEVTECLQSLQPAVGNDAAFNVAIPPRHRATFDFRQLGANAALYLLDTCDPLEPVCIEGADRGFGLQTETITRFNSGNTPEIYTLVVDAMNPQSGGLFFLDYTADEVPDPELVDVCVESIDSPALLPGEYYAGEPDRLLNDVDPGFLGCTGTSLSGADGTRRVDVPAGQTLEVTVAMPDGNPALYLHRDCDDLSTCVLGDDQAGEIETLLYTNNTGVAEVLYLTLDTVDDLKPYFLTLTIN